MGRVGDDSIVCCTHSCRQMSYASRVVDCWSTDDLVCYCPEVAVGRESQGEGSYSVSVQYEASHLNKATAKKTTTRLYVVVGNTTLVYVGAEVQACVYSETRRRLQAEMGLRLAKVDWGAVYNNLHKQVSDGETDASNSGVSRCRKPGLGSFRSIPEFHNDLHSPTTHSV